MLGVIFGVLGKIGAAVGVLQQFGVNLGPQANDVLNVLEHVPVNLTNFENGNPVVIAHFSEQGKKGTLVAVLDGGQAAQLIGL